MSFFINLAIVAVNADNFYAPECAQIDSGPYACMLIKGFNDSGLVLNSDDDYGRCSIPGKIPEGEGVCADFGLKTEGYALKSALGPFNLYMWALGLFAAGQAATMVCTYAGQIIMGGTLEVQLAPWVRVAITRVFALGAL